MSKLSRKIQTLTHGQLWVATVAILFFAGLIYVGRVEWAKSALAQTELLQRIGADALTTGGERASEGLKLIEMSRTAGEEFRTTAAWFIPLVTLIVFVIAPVSILGLHWIWHRAR
jgi:hypothetical protein